MKKYEYEENVVDTTLFRKDELTFSVLAAIVNSKSRIVITDHKRYIICHSCAPFPVWIWVPDDVTDDELDIIWEITKSEIPFHNGYGYNTKYCVADYFIKRSREEQINLEITMNLLTYDCEEPIPPSKTSEGCISKPSSGDIKDITEFIWLFKQDIGIDMETKEQCRQKAYMLVQEGSLYLWKNSYHENVAMCSYGSDGRLGKVMHVYTKSSERRKGYAENLVYEVTKLIKANGLLPVLYTDADYVASNECYKRIGYVERGKLCTIAVS
jgi:predicted GNAT family acetyltransferase